MKDSEDGLQIYVALKHVGNLTKNVKEYPFMLGRVPHTLRELIEESVRSCILAYRSRADSAENPTPLTDEQWSEMKEIGKFAFGVHYNDKAIDESKAIEAATQAFEDGLVRVFCGSAEITELDRKMDISPGDAFTFVRLTMLTGRMW